MSLSENRDKVIEFVKNKGAVLPIEISKEFKVDTMFSSAMLSELVNANKMKSTQHLRVGGSAVYYTKEEKLEEYLKFLNERDRETLQFLKKKKIVFDKELSPLQRVSYRIVKDFAKSIVLKKDDDSKEVFWRYYLVDEEEAKKTILELVKDTNESQKKVDEYEPSLKKENKSFLIHKDEKRQESEEKVEENILKKKAISEEETIKKLSKEVDNDLIKDFFKTNGMSVLNEKIIKKDKDSNYVVSFDSKVGNLKYFVKFRDKKRINDGDISLAFNEAGKLPLMFLSKGELTKPAQKLIDEDFKGVVFKKLNSKV